MPSIARAASLHLCISEAISLCFRGGASLPSKLPRSPFIHEQNQGRPLADNALCIMRLPVDVGPFLTFSLSLSNTYMYLLYLLWDFNEEELKLKLRWGMLIFSSRV